MNIIIFLLGHPMYLFETAISILNTYSKMQASQASVKSNSTIIKLQHLQSFKLESQDRLTEENKLVISDRADKIQRQTLSLKKIADT